MTCKNPDLSASIRRLLAGERGRIAKLFARYRIAPWDAEDMLQEALIALAAKWETIENQEKYLLGILRYKCFAYLRRRYRCRLTSLDPDIFEDMPAGEETAQERRELLFDLEALSASLPPRERQVLFLRFRLGLTGAEIAAELTSWSRGTLERDVWRGIARLKSLAGKRTRSA